MHLGLFLALELMSDVSHRDEIGVVILLHWNGARLHILLPKRYVRQDRITLLWLHSSGCYLVGNLTQFSVRLHWMAHVVFTDLGSIESRKALVWIDLHRCKVSRDGYHAGLLDLRILFFSDDIIGRNREFSFGLT